MNQIIKQHQIKITGLNGAVPPVTIGRDLADMPGISEVRYDGNGVLDLSYDLMETNLLQIENAVRKLGGEPKKDILQNIKRGWIHFTEKNEFDNLMSIPSHCCALDEHERVVREDVQEQVPKAKKNTAIRTGLQV